MPSELFRPFQIFFRSGNLQPIPAKSNPFDRKKQIFLLPSAPVFQEKAAGLLLKFE